MNFGFTEEQEMIRKSARDFTRGRSSMERIRRMHADERGWDPALFTQIAEQGWLGAVFPEDLGGIGLGYVDLLCIQEELGKGLIPEPLFTSSVMGGNAVFLGGTDAQKSEILPGVCSGELILAFAHYEADGRFDATHVAAAAKETGGDFVLNGAKSFVDDAGHAGKIVISARTSGGVTDESGVSLFLVDRNAPGLTLTPISTIDRRRRYTLEMKDVKAETLLGAKDKALPAILKVIDRATVALCAEMLGGMEQALNMSVAYSKERVQFDKPIGSFQAIKHKAANMFVALETARSAVYYATMAVDEDMPDVREAISCAKTLCSDAYLKIGKDAIQIHGGIGFTDECDVQFFYKRAIVTHQMFGDPDHHRDRYAALKGF